MSGRNYITVSELNFYLNRIISAEELLHDMYLLGEVSGASVNKGNLYCTLKDEGAQISVCCFGAGKTHIPADGERVLMFGTPDFYAKTGKMSFVARKIEPFGVGELHLELEALKKRLAEEGLFSEAHKTPAPKYSKDVCVVTSINGAVIRDIVSTVRKYNECINIAVVNVQVQGKSAATEIVSGLRLADRGGFDTVILARGGGSFEDLLPFNSEEVARALYEMDTYVISAVGHETDYTIADFVADTRALTPTAAAELVAFDTDALVADVKQSLAIASRKLENRILSYQKSALECTRRVMYLTSANLAALEARVGTAVTSARVSAQNAISRKEAALQGVLSKLSALNPANLLNAGYFKAEKGGKPVNKVCELSQGERFTLVGVDGKLTAEVIERSKK